MTILYTIGAVINATVACMCAIGAAQYYAAGKAWKGLLLCLCFGIVVTMFASGVQKL
jgi:hypothetical protein